MKKQNGITLIALVITIIVMLILVGVSVTVALNGGLFSTAKEAAEGTASKRNEELELSSGKVEINGEWYNSIDEYVNGNGVGEQKVTILPQKETYNIGDKVTIANEAFFVIADDAEKITLLAKDCIITDENSTDYLKQSESAETVAFSNTNYWSSETEYPLNLNDYPIPEGVTSVTTIAKAYGTKLGGTGRLMTKGETDKLNTVLYNMSNFWLNTAVSNDEINFWYYADQVIHSYTYTGPAEGVGLRPVVEISKSNVSLNEPSLESGTYSIGDEVTVRGESFYVIKESSATETTITLLAKDCIEITNLVQSANATITAFSETNYWSDASDLWEASPPESSHKAARAAYDYGLKLGGTGRLMTYSEAISLQSTNKYILYGTHGKSSSEYGLSYWLSPFNAPYGSLWNIAGSTITTSAWDDGGWCGVRPVVEISKSNIS